MMKKLFTGELISYAQREDVVDRIIDGAPRTFALAIGAAIIWFVARRRARPVQRGARREVVRPRRHGARARRHLDAGVLARRADELLPRLQARDLPQRRLRPDQRGRRLGVGQPPDHAVDRAVDPVHRRLLARRCARACSTRSTTTTCARRARRASASGACCVRHVLRNSLIPVVTLWGLDFGAVLGGGAILTETVFDIQGVGQYFAESIGSLDVPPVLAVVAVRRVLHRAAERDRRHRLRGARPADPPLMTDAKRLLDVEHLQVDFRTEDGVVHAVDDVSFDLRAGEVLAVVGESGSGKSVTAMTLMGLTPSAERDVRGHRATSARPSSSTASDDELRQLRGKEIAMIFQDPMTSLNPVHRIGEQIVEQIQAHETSPTARRATARRAARARRHPAGARARRLLPARVLRRHAPARDDRDGAVVRPVGAHRRRADDGARRDDPGADPARMRDLRERTGAARHPRHPRPRRRRRHRRPHRRHVRGADRRDGHARRDLLRPAAPVHVGPAGLDRPHRPPAARAPAVDPGHAAVAARPPGGLPLPPALPRTSSRSARRRRRSRRGSGSAGPRRPLLAAARGASARSARSPTGQIGLEAEGAIA